MDDKQESLPMPDARDLAAPPAEKQPEGRKPEGYHPAYCYCPECRPD